MVGALLMSLRLPEDLIKNYYLGLQSALIQSLEQVENESSRFQRDSWQRAEGGGGITAVLEEGQIFEKAGIAFSDVNGAALPEAATRQRTFLKGSPFRAMGVSVVIHPRSPMIPTAHMNVRFFRANHAETGEPVWWFGGGYDLTPYYPYKEDCIHWHQTTHKVCIEHYNEDFFQQLKQRCDNYFYIRHRGTMRGVGGIFFDDLNEPDFDTCFAFMKAVGRSFADAYLPIIDRRKDEAYGQRERDFQNYRRGRYVEFNLVYDRGTLFGLQSGGRTESILMSLPPHVQFKYDWKPEPGSREAELEEYYLQPRDWLANL